MDKLGDDCLDNVMDDVSVCLDDVLDDILDLYNLYEDGKTEIKNAIDSVLYQVGRLAYEKLVARSSGGNVWQRGKSDNIVTLLLMIDRTGYVICFGLSTPPFVVV